MVLAVATRACWRRIAASAAGSAGCRTGIPGEHDHGAAAGEDEQDVHSHGSGDRATGGPEYSAGPGSDHSAGHGGGHADHSGPRDDVPPPFLGFFGVVIPVLIFSPTLQSWFGFSLPAFTGSGLRPSFPWLCSPMAACPSCAWLWEIRERTPGMMTLISLAITVALVYSLAALVIDPQGGFFWELVL